MSVLTQDRYVSVHVRDNDVSYEIMSQREDDKKGHEGLWNAHPCCRSLRLHGLAVPPSMPQP